MRYVYFVALLAIWFLWILAYSPKQREAQWKRVFGALEDC